MAVEFDPFDPATRLDPYPSYHRLRAEDPVHWSPRLRSWLLTRHADAEMALRDPRFSADRLAADKFVGPRKPRAMRSLGSDPPEHTAVRALAVKGFTPRQVEALRPRVAELVDQLLDRIPPGETFDLIDDFAYPLPITVIAEMFGVPEEDRPQFRAWSAEVARSMDHFYSQRGTGTAMSSLAQYMGGLLSKRRAEPGPDLVSHLLLVEEEGDTLTEAELVALCAVLVFAGHETTTNLIGNGILALMRHPDQLAALGEDPSVARVAVEELLRFDSPAQAISRTLVEDVEVDGATLRKGESALSVLGAANRDAAVFADPDALDIRRDPNPHIAFGHGIHFCLGAVLTRREAQIALPALIARYPRLALAGEPEWRDTFILRGMKHLPVAG